MNTAHAEDSRVISVARRLAPSFAWMVPLLGLLALVAWDGAARIHRSLELSRHYDVAVRAPALDPASATGYALQRRSLLTPVLAPDALHWVMQTQEMSARGETRVRHVDYDNAPTGRPVHWAAPYRWWLLALAHLDRLSSGTPLPLAIERATLWSGPAMLGLFLAILIPFTARRLGTFAALVLGAGLAGSSTFAVQFMAGNADHHAPVAICALATVLVLIVRPADPAAGVPRAHIASAIAGAFGLWLSAATMIPVLIGIGLGVGAARGWTALSRTSREPRPAGTPWRWWGAVGAGATLLAYLVEYAPDNFGWRLEVIHPLYALAWLAGGELLCRISELRAGSPLKVSLRASVLWVVVSGAVILPAVVIAALGTRVFLPTDEFLRSLHGDYIAEFQGMARFLSGRALDLDLVGRLTPLAMFILALGLLARRSPTTAAKEQLAVAAGPALVMFVLAMVQIRWWGLGGGLGMIVVALACRRSSQGASRGTAAVVAILLLAPGLAQTARTAAQAGATTATDVRRLAERDVAHRLRLRSDADPLVIAATPDETTSLVYFAGARGLGTMYWENVDGLKTTAAILGAPNEKIAHDLITSAGVTHVVLFPWDPSDENCIRLHRGLPPDAPIPADAFGLALKHGRVPSWLKPLAHKLPDHELLRDQVVRLYEVTDGRSPERVAVDAAAFLMEMGRFQEAAALEPVLANYLGDLAAQATLAGMQARRKEARAFGATVQRVMGLLSSNYALPLEDRVRVVMALAIAGQEQRAAEEMRRGLATADERAVRRLSPGSLSDLFELSSALQVPWPDPALHALAAELALRESP